MTALCQITNCTRPADVHNVMCKVCVLQLPDRMLKDISRAWSTLKHASKPNMKEAAARRYRDAKRAAVDYVNKQKQEKVSA